MQSTKQHKQTHNSNTMLNLCWWNLPHRNNIKNWFAIKLNSFFNLGWLVNHIICKYVDWLCKQVQHSNISCKLGWLNLPKSNNTHIPKQPYTSPLSHVAKGLNLQVVLILMESTASSLGPSTIQQLRSAWYIVAYSNQNAFFNVLLIWTTQNDNTYITPLIYTAIRMATTSLQS